MRRSVSIALTILIFVVPVALFASTTGCTGENCIVPCKGPECTACHAVELGQNLLTWTIRVMSLLIAIIFAIGGFKMVMAGGDTGKVSEARSMMTNAVIGFVLLLTAWLIIDTLLKHFIGGTIDGRPWHEIKCVSVEPITSTLPTGTITATPTPTPSGALSHADALTLLQSKGVVVTSSQNIVQADCSSTSGCTSLQGIRQSTIDQAIKIKEACPTCTVAITGGTESTGGHAVGTLSHGTGYKIDIDDNQVLDSFLTSKLTQDGYRSGSGGGPRYRDRCGNEYVRESTHWDITVVTTCAI